MSIETIDAIIDEAQRVEPAKIRFVQKSDKVRILSLLKQLFKSFKIYLPLSGIKQI